MKEKEKGVKKDEHGVLYFVESGKLCYYPLLKDGGVDKEGVGLITEAPKKFKKGHLDALKKLGYSKKKREKMVKDIEYY